VRNHVVFLENYNIAVARYLVQGCDVWLNTPLRPNEASGTSGMKLLPNGGLNFSILDGWWDEGYDREVGWAIGRGEDYKDADYQNKVESQALYNTLENDIVPLYYARDAQNIPRGWVAKMKASMRRLTPVFNTNRMVAEYAERFYLRAHERHERLAADCGQKVFPLVEWRKRIRDKGAQVRVTHVSSEIAGAVQVGSEIQVEARVALGEVLPTDVRLQIYYGKVGADGQVVDGRPTEMKLVQSQGAEHLYRGTLECADSGSCGFTIRVVPYHEDAIVPYEMPWVVWAE
jgi:starch phosphorylase